MIQQQLSQSNLLVHTQLLCFQSGIGKKAIPGPLPLPTRHSADGGNDNENERANDANGGGGCDIKTLPLFPRIHSGSSHSPDSPTTATGRDSDGQIPWQKCRCLHDTGISSHFGAKLRDWAIGQAGAGCYFWAALSSNDSKTRYKTV